MGGQAVSYKASEAVADRSDSRGHARLVMFVLAEAAHMEDASCYLSTVKIADRAKCSRNTVTAAVKALAAAGEVRVWYRKVKRSDGAVNLYQVVLPGLPHDQQPPQAGGEAPDAGPGFAQTAGEPRYAQTVGEQYDQTVGVPGGVRPNDGGGSPNLGVREPSLEPDYGNGNVNVKDIDTDVVGSAPRARACWEEPVESDDWSPTYSFISPPAMSSLLAEGQTWADPPTEAAVFDFWRDLYWHFDAAYTDTVKSSVCRALEIYAHEPSMVFRAVAGARHDRYVMDRDHDGRSPRDTLDFILSQKHGDSVDRYSRYCQTGNDLVEAANDAEDNRKCMTAWRLERFDLMEEDWRHRHRDRLNRDAGRMRRYRAFQQDRETNRAAA